MMSREQFLADMIKELSRQQSEDAVGFNQPRKLTDTEVFRKMCFSFPIVDREDIERLSNSLDKILKQHSTSLADAFCLDETLLDNICGLSEKQDDKSSVAQVMAAQVFLKMPKHLLTCSKGQLSRLFAKYAHDDGEVGLPNSSRNSISWNDIIKKFKSLVLRGNSSLLSELSFKTVSEGFYLVSFLSVISCLDKLVQLSSSSNPPGDVRGSEEDYLDQLDEIWDANPGNNNLSLEAVLQRIAHMNNGDSRHVAMFKQLWLHCIFIYRDVLIRIPSLIGSYLSPLCEVLLQNSVSNNSIGAAAGGGQSADMSSLFSFKPKEATIPYPTSSECAFVMTVSNIATYLVSPPAAAAAATSAVAGSSTTASDAAAVAQQLGSARSALREYFTGKGRLVTLVDICERMATSGSNAGVNNSIVMGKGKAVLAEAVSTASNNSVVEIESVSFLLDVCSVFVSDLRNGAYTYNNISSSTSSGSSGSSGGGGSKPSAAPISTSKHFEALITSRALGTLVTALVSIIQQSAGQVGGIVSSAGDGTDNTRPSSQNKAAGLSNLSALSARLLRFFTCACLHSGAVCSFLLATPDFISVLSSLHATAWSPLLQVLQSASHGVSMRQLDDALSLFAPSSTLGLLTVLVLSSRDKSTTDLLVSLLESSVQLISQHQTALPGLQRTSRASSVSSAADSGGGGGGGGGDSRSDDSFVMVETAAAAVVAATADPAVVVEQLEEEQEAQYTPEEVAEKSASQASGVETHRSVTRVMVALTATVGLLTSEADGAPHMRAVFRSAAAGTALFKTQKLFRSQMAGDLLRLTSSQLTALMAMETAAKESVDDVVARQGADPDSTDSTSVGDAVASSVKAPAAATLPVMNVRNIRIAHEGLKKQLKALQSLIEGNGSNKTD